MDGPLVSFAAALMLILGGALAYRGRRPGAKGLFRSPKASAAPAPPGAPTEGASDMLKYLQRLEAQGSPGLAGEVVEIFLQDTSSRLIALRRAIAQEDGETVLRVAHALQGSASMISAASVARSCEALANSARSGSFDQCRIRMAELDARFEAIRMAMPLSGPTGPEQIR